MNTHFISCDGHQLYERGVDLEVEGVRYIEAESIHATSSTYTSPETPKCEIPSNGVVEISLLSVCTGETSI